MSVRRTLVGIHSLALAALAFSASVTLVAEPVNGFLVETAENKLGPEARAALLRARELTVQSIIRCAPGGKFLDEAGRSVSLDRFQVIWYHQGDSSQLTGPAYERKALDTLRGYVRRGGGLFLSGAALAMIHQLRIEPAMPRVGGPGSDSAPAGLVPVVPGHPIFKGLKFKGKTVPISNRGYPAFADFHPGRGPTAGMLLARTPGGTENPLAEYSIGKGRILVMGWRLPHYAYRANPHRANLERLTANILAYLAKKRDWQKVVLRPVPKPKPVAGQEYTDPGLSEQNLRSLSLAVDDLIKTCGERYLRGREYVRRLKSIQEAYKELRARGTKSNDVSEERKAELDRQFKELRREALLSNPLIDFDRILVVKRSESSPRLGLVQNWQSNSSLPHTGYENEIDVLSDFRSGGKLSALFKPDGTRFVGDVDLHFSGKKMLFSMPGQNGRWQVHELNADGTGLRELALIRQPDVDNYDACYLPDGKILFTSTAPFVGVPCVTGSSHVSNIYVLEKNGSIRRLTFEQDHDWCPTVLNSGKVLYLRWEYSDIPHFVSRILFQMNPDGSGQTAYYGSNSYWPNAMFYARPCPGHPTRFVAIVGGHHDVPRMGELVVFDTARGRYEADGVIQRIPGYGKKVAPIIRDGLVRGSWPKFLHPWPLSDKYIIVSAKPTPRSRWGIYLVDVFDNLLLLKEEPYFALFEPIPFRKVTPPPIIPDRVQPGRKDAVVFISDIYRGGGLEGVPRGTVKQLRVYSYQFAYHGMGGQVNRVGLDGPWDIKRVLGTVPVEPDGSARFRVPANTPFALHPLDSRGRALQLMRSWMTGMPGEELSCAGCHERQNRAGPTGQALALSKPPAEISSWYGPVRGFSFKREVQPVLDRYCVHCHDGKVSRDETAIPDLRARPPVHPRGRGKGYNNGTRFTPSYLALRSYVRGPSIESDIHLLNPCEYHAGTTRLVQMLEKGHHDVQIDAEGWDRINTWIDLNTPAHGTWHEIVGTKRVANQRERRRALNKLYANLDEDPEAVYPTKYGKGEEIWRPRSRTEFAPAPGKMPSTEAHCPGWPFDEPEAKRRQAVLGAVRLTVNLGGGVKIELVRIPAGEFVMGETNGLEDERPAARVSIVESFWLGKFEVTNAQFHQFDPAHDSRVESGDFLQFSVRERGYPVNDARQPVCRVSWREAMAFCRWLSERSHRNFSLPTEAEWEYACRAGTGTPLWYGKLDADFARFANLADQSLRRVDTFGFGLPSGAVPPWRPSIVNVNDRFRVSAPVGSFAPNPWGLYDMHGNVSEWTRSTYEPYPVREESSRRRVSETGPKVVRGGSWYDRPKRARSAFRQSYRSWQRVYDVGFRVICRDEPRQARRN